MKCFIYLFLLRTLFISSSTLHSSSGKWHNRFALWLLKGFLSICVLSLSPLSLCRKVSAKSGGRRSIVSFVSLMSYCLDRLMSITSSILHSGRGQER